MRFLVERGAYIDKDQNTAGSASSFVMQVRDTRNGVLRDNPDVRPYDETLALLDDLAAGCGS